MLPKTLWGTNDCAEANFWGVLIILFFVALAAIFTKVYPWYIRVLFLGFYSAMVFVACTA
ncbi:MAG: hypothetical protein DRN30_06240 [Thermoplasmata archaeon]|nr:MAG: hypothetical protein DRN30_06240 [Thermoplasmata archaeon]